MVWHIHTLHPPSATLTSYVVCRVSFVVCRVRVRNARALLVHDINNRLLSGALQLVVMPWAMVRVDPFVLLRSLPVVAGSGFFVTFVSPGFRTAAAAFVVVKVLDYSIRCESGG